MITSMTGFGRGTARNEAASVTVEVRSVNNRHLDVPVRLPAALAERETAIQALVKQALTRGRVSVQVQVERLQEDDLPVRVDAAAARAYTRLLEQLRAAAGIDEPVRLEHLLRFSDVLTVAATPEAPHQEALWEATCQALAEALDGLRHMRRQEGQALEADLAARLDAIEEHLVAVETRAPARVLEARTRLQERIAELLGDERLDPDRLEQEIALLADRLDVTEECVRLRSHLALFREAFGSDEPAGRKLNFIVQEIHREVNTIGAKANDAVIARLSVQMKEEVEKIREQIQNVE